MWTQAIHRMTRLSHIRSILGHNGHLQMDNVTIQRLDIISIKVERKPLLTFLLTNDQMFSVGKVLRYVLVIYHVKPLRG